MPHAGRPSPAASTTPAAVLTAFDAFCASEGVPEDVAWRFRVVIDELVSNILAHGTVAGSVPAIDVSFRREASTVSAVITDDGPPFDPFERPLPALDLPLEARKAGGLGIVLVKALMDVATYQRTTHNVVTVSKTIVTAAAPDAGIE